MTSARTHALLVLQLAFAAGCGCNRESSMSSPAPTSPVLTAFTPLRGGFSQAIAPGGRLVTLLNGAATWWDGDAPVTATLPPQVPVAGARFTADGASLRVGLGTLDLAARTWRPEPALETWAQPGPDGFVPVRQVAWFSDAAHVALLLERRAPDGARSQELVVVGVDGTLRGRRPVEGATAMIASEDRLLVVAGTLALLDLDAGVVAAPSPVPDSVVRLGHGGGMFAAVGIAGAVALVRPSDGAVLATWDVHAADAVPVEHGVVVVDQQGTVRVGCLDGGGVREVATVASGASAPIIQRVGDRIVIAGSDADPVRVAAFANPCRAPTPDRL